MPPFHSGNEKGKKGEKREKGNRRGEGGTISY
jgi:hypothetical protein